MIHVSHQVVYHYVPFSGLKFWKVGSRKIFAVRESELKENLKKSSSTGNRTIINLYSSSSDDDSTGPQVKRRRMDIPYTDVSTALLVVKDKLDKIFCLSRNMAVPIGLRSIFTTHSSASSVRALWSPQSFSLNAVKQ